MTPLTLTYLLGLLRCSCQWLNINPCDSNSRDGTGQNTPDPPTPWSPAVQTAQITTKESWCCEPVGKKRLFLTQCASVWFIYSCFIGKYVFSHANQRFSSKNMKKGVCRDTRMAKKCTFYKSHKKTPTVTWMHKWVSTANTTSVIVTSDSHERDQHVGGWHELRLPPERRRCWR